MSDPGAVIIGASAGVGRALAAKLARAGYRLVLVSRDSRDLESLCRDLAVRFGTEAHPLTLDLLIPDLEAGSIHERCFSLIDPIDTLLIPAGWVSDDDDGLVGPDLVEQTVQVNYLSPLKLINCFARNFREQNRGTIVAFTSIAAASPRRRNMVYGSAKAALEFYLRALRHYFADSDVIVQGYALGYVDTSLSFGKKLLFPVVSPDRVAEVVIRDLHRDIGVVYYPRFWRFVIILLKLMPWFLYRRLSF